MDGGSDQPQVQHVAVLLPDERDCFRQTLLGISAFALTEPSWQVQRFVPRGRRFKVDLSRYDGLLLGPFGLDITEPAARSCGGPVVNVFNETLRHTGQVGAIVLCDDSKVGRLGAEYFLKQGFRHFGFVGVDTSWSDVRRRAFVGTIESAGGSVQCLQISTKTQLWPGVTHGPMQSRLAAWLGSMPTPTAIMTCNDDACRRVAQVCQDRGIVVPGQVSLLGVDDDEVECELGVPKLSSVALPWRRVGFEASRILDGLMRGRRRGRFKPTVHRFDPDRVMVRRSTEAPAADDDDVARVVEYIEQHAHVPTSVADLLPIASMSRRALELRFRSAVGRSPAEEIRRVHIKRASELLAQTQLPVKQIALRSGFSSAAQFSRIFRSATGQSPSAYRIMALGR